MTYAVLLDVLLGAVAGYLCGWAALWAVRRRLYSVECDLADLQDRHLRSVRKQAAFERWKPDEEAEAAVEELFSDREPPKKEGWKKWGSKSASSLEPSQKPPALQP